MGFVHDYMGLDFCCFFGSWTVMDLGTTVRCFGDGHILLFIHSFSVIELVICLL